MPDGTASSSPAGLVLSLSDGLDMQGLLAQAFQGHDAAPPGTDGDRQAPWRWWRGQDLDWVEGVPALLCHPGDRTAWARLKDALARLIDRRPARPVDGLVLGVDPASHTRGDADAARAALRARAVLDAVADQTGWQVPLFVLLALGRGGSDPAALLRSLPPSIAGRPIGHRIDPGQEPRALFDAVSGAFDALAARLALLAPMAARGRTGTLWQALPAARAALTIGTTLTRHLLAPSDEVRSARLAGIYCVPADPPDMFGLDALTRIIPADLGHIARR